MVGMPSKNALFLRAFGSRSFTDPRVRRLFGPALWTLCGCQGKEGSSLGRRGNIWRQKKTSPGGSVLTPRARTGARLQPLAVEKKLPGKDCWLTPPPLSPQSS